VTAGIPDEAVLAVWLTGRIAGYLHLGRDAVPPDAPLRDVGVDSVTALALCNDLEDEFGVAVDPTIVFDFPTVDAIAGHLAGLDRAGTGTA
jgi:acyl carrier protein